ncbi:MAG: hypothetical protein U1F66_01295 [bacterium]
MTLHMLRVRRTRLGATGEAPAAAAAQQGFAQALFELAAIPDPSHLESSQALRRWAEAVLAHPQDLGPWAGLSEGERSILRARFGSRLDELASLSQERDPQLLAEGLMALARRSVEGEDPSAGLALYQYLSRAEGALASNLNGELRARAAAEAAAWRGEGTFGRRFEIQARQFARQASDPALIAGMGLASLAASAVRLGVLSRLAASPRAGFLTRGLGASLTAGTAAWAVEVPTFWAGTRMAHLAMGSSGLGWDRATVARELASTGLMLGLLKLSGAAAGALFQRAHGIAPLHAEAAGLPALTRLSQPLYTQAASFAGLYTDHLIEERLGWRPRTDALSRGFDSLATLLQFHVGGRLAAEALGPGYASALRQLEFRSRVTETLLTPRPNLGVGPGPALQPALAGIGGASPAVETGERPWEAGILAMSQVKPERSRARRGGRSAPLDSRTGERPPEQEEGQALRAFREAPAAGLDRLVKGIHERGRLAQLALDLEANGLRPDLGPAEFARAREVLRNLEDEFWLYLDQGRQSVPIAQRWEVFQNWQNELVPKGIAGFVQLQERLRSIGIADLSAIKNGEIRMKTRVRDSQEAADYFLDLAVLRNFLRTRGFNRVDESNPNGRYLSNLLLRGDGNCATLSLLFAHLAVTTGRALQVGLLPRHVYLAGREGAAIESILDFGVTSASAYRNRAIGPEQKLLPGHSLLSVHLFNLGKGAVERGDLANARWILERARELLPGSPRADLLLAQVAQRQGDFAATLAHYRRVHALHPTDAKGLNNLRMRAWERFVAGQYGEAEQAFRRLNGLVPEDLDVLRALRLTYERMGLRREAEGVGNLIDILELDAEEP